MSARIRAGKLDRMIAIETKSETIDTYGAPVEVWTALGNFRAELVFELRDDSATTQMVREGGAIDSIETIYRFRTRWIEGLSVADRVFYNGLTFDIIGLQEIPRRKGWEIVCRHRGL